MGMACGVNPVVLRPDWAGRHKKATDLLAWGGLSVRADESGLQETLPDNGGIGIMAR
jgi:hypothetical protein